MSKVLYITANPRKKENSYSLTVGEEFITEYEKEHPEDTITRIDLYDSEIQNLDGKIIDYNFGMIDEEQLSDECKLKMKITEETVAQFMKHDKYVFVTPLWNLSVPPIVRTYFDNVCITGKTFKYTENGTIGLLEDKKAIHIQASGGIYSEEPMSEFEHGTSYIKSVLNFLGVNDVEQLLIEGTNITELDQEKVKEDAIKKADELAKEF